MKKHKSITKETFHSLTLFYVQTIAPLPPLNTKHPYDTTHAKTSIAFRY
uniref:Uncharacterized protein n=1 Tax=Anguilla anguilla TaxID=7936 RepID=A0A0E9W732_ANGAN